MSVEPRIEFDSQNECYYAGEIVSGKLHLVLDRPLEVEGINVTFLGEAVVLWNEYESRETLGETRQMKVDYQGREEYCNFIHQVCGMTTLHPGPTSLPFQYQLPYVVPSSYEGEHGKIWYRAIATIKLINTPLTPDDEIFRIFHVVAPLDLNKDADALKPIEIEFEEVYSCCCCESGVMTLSVRSGESGYCPGQTIPLEIAADNGSNFEVQNLTLTLEKCEVFRSQQPQSEYQMPSEKLASVKKGAISSKSKMNFNVELVVPDMIAPNLENCGIIDVFYSLKVSFDVSGCNDGDNDEADIFIGLLPLNKTITSKYIHPMADGLPKGPIPEPNNTINQNWAQNYPNMYSAQSYPNPPNANMGQNYPNETYPIGFTMGFQEPGNNSYPTGSTNVSPSAPPF